MLKKSHYIALGVVTVLALIILNLPGRTTARFKLAIGSLFLPLFGLTGASQQLAGKAGNALLPRSELTREIQALHRENQQLRILAMQGEELARENTRLRGLLHWQGQTRWNLRLAHVIVREPANWWRTVQISLGSRDGVRDNLPVLTADGLIGRIATVSLTHSQVLLLGDPNCRVSAVVENEAHDKGIIVTGGPFDGSLVKMSFLPSNAILKPGQNVVTSDDGGLFPKGIRIGKVVDSRTVDFGLSTEARVKLGANLGSLEEVWVWFP